MSRHIMWRDELQVWMVVKASATLGDLFHNLKYEWHPSFWYVLVWAAKAFGSSPLTMQVLHVTVAAISVALVWFCSPFSRLQKLCISLSYFLVFEYAVISRNYAIAALLSFIFAAIPRSDRTRVARALVLVCLMNCTFYGLFLTFCLMAGEAMRIVATPVQPNEANALTPKPRSHGPAGDRRGVFLELGIAALGFLAFVISVGPSGGHPADWNFHPELARIRELSIIFLNAFFPIPDFLRDHWWNTLFIRVNSTVEFLGLLLVFGALITIVRKFESYLAVAFGLLVTIVLVFSYARIYGTLRHHGILFVGLLVMSWISLRERPTLKTDAAWNRAWAMLLVPQLLGGIIATSLHFARPFSESLATVQWIKDHGHADEVIVGHDDLVASSIAGYLEKPIFYPDFQEFGTYIKYRGFDHPDFHRSAVDSARGFAASGRGVVIVLNESLSPAVMERDGLESLATFDHAITDEDYFVYGLKSGASVVPHAK